MLFKNDDQIDFIQSYYRKQDVVLTIKQTPRFKNLKQKIQEVQTKKRKLMILEQKYIDQDQDINSIINKGIQSINEKMSNLSKIRINKMFLIFIKNIIKTILIEFKIKNIYLKINNNLRLRLVWLFKKRKDISQTAYSKIVRLGYKKGYTIIIQYLSNNSIIDQMFNKSEFFQEIQNILSENSPTKDNNNQKYERYKIKIGKIIDQKQIDQQFKFNSYVNYLKKINIQNNQINFVQNEIKYYKVYVGKGNNNQIIESVFKKRWWWKITDNIDEDCQCIWTPLKKQSLIDQMKNYENQLSRYFLKTQSINTLQECENELMRLFTYVEKDQFYKNLTLKKKSLIEFQIQKLMPNFRIISDDIKQCHNHIDKNYHLGNKKLLFYNIKNYCETMKQNPFDYIPVTFHIKAGVNDPEFQKFLNFYEKREQEKQKNIYIIKPGEQTNRGFGITVQNDLRQIKQILNRQEKYQDGGNKTFIIQLYIDKPLLYNKRKFDIRCFLLMTSQNGILKAYWYEEGYARTSCYQFTLKNFKNKYIHLTNDAIQSKAEDYGKFESGNKLSYKELDKYIQQNYNGKDFYKYILPEMKNITLLTVKSVYGQIDQQRKDNSFEIFGLDFMIDEDFKVYLIEVNTNPCMEITSTLQARLIPNLLDNALSIALDPVYLPPDLSKWSNSKKEQIPENQDINNKFELIFNEIVDGKKLQFYSFQNKITNNKNLAFEEEINEEIESFKLDKIQTSTNQQLNSNFDIIDFIRLRKQQDQFCQSKEIDKN